MIAFPWWAYVIVAIGLVAAYYFSLGRDKLRRTLVFLATTVGLVAATLQLQSNALEHREAVEHRKREVSFRYIDRWEDAAEKYFSPMRELGAFASSHQPAQTDSFLKASRDRMNAWSKVSSLFESIGLAVKTDFADERSLCEYFGAWAASGPAMRYFSALKPWIDFERQRAGDRSLLEHYEWIYDRWKRGCPHTRAITS